MTSNAEMIECWNTRAGIAWLQAEDALERAFEPLGTRAVVALGLRDGERVLDVGCGSGYTSLALARAVGTLGSVTGVDVSHPMLQRAAERALRAGLADRIRWVEHDAQTAEFGEGRFDAIYSRFGVMFFADPVTAFRRFRRATHDLGRLACVAWQSRRDNIWFDLPARVAAEYVEMVTPALDDQPGPFGFANKDRIHRLLITAGWRDVEISSLHESILLGSDVEAAISLLSTIGPVGAALRQAQVSEASHAHVLDAMRKVLSQFVTVDGIRMPAAAWLVHARHSPIELSARDDASQS